MRYAEAKQIVIDMVLAANGQRPRQAAAQLAAAQVMATLTLADAIIEAAKYPGHHRGN